MITEQELIDLGFKYCDITNNYFYTVNNGYSDFDVIVSLALQTVELYYTEQDSVYIAKNITLDNLKKLIEIMEA